MEARCMRCRKQVEITELEITKTSRGGNIAKGKCGTCGTKLCRMMKKDADESN